MDLISYFACIFIRSTQLLTSNVLTSLAVFGGRKAQLRDPERLCLGETEKAWRKLGESNLPRVVRTKPPPRNKLGTCCLSSAVTSFPSLSHHPLTKA